jgi:beta-1,4-N-acetylglucosaminyltransferase
VFVSLVSITEMAVPANVMDSSQKRLLHKECFVTIGATAGFEDLLLAAVSNEVLDILAELNFTDLTIQCGTMNDYFTKIKPADNKGLRITNFGFKAQGLENEMRRCQSRKGVSEEGLVICHAGQ